MLYHKSLQLKGQFTPKSKEHIPLTCSAFYQSRSFWCELLSFGDKGHRDVCLVSNVMELNGTQHVVLKVPVRCLFSVIMNRLLKIIHKLFREEFLAGTVFCFFLRTTPDNLINTQKQTCIRAAQHIVSASTSQCAGAK